LTALSRKPPAFAVRALLFAAAFVASLFVAEWSVRLALPDYDPASQVTFVRDPASGLTLSRPNTVSRQIKNSGDYNVEIRINRHGLRDARDVATGTAADLYVVGDSFTFGWGVEETERFSSLLEKALGRRTFTLSSSVNIDSYPGMVDYAVLLGATVRDVVVAINMIDDFVETAPASAQAAAPAPRPDYTVIDYINIAKLRLTQNSALYFALVTSLKTSQWLQDALVSLGVVATLETNILKPPEEAAIEQSIDALKVIDGKYNLTVMLIPARGLWIGDRQEAVSRHHETIRRRLEARGIRVLDLRPILEAGGNPMQYHFRTDGHWRPAGHALAARVLADFLRAAPGR
jgi:hypothetical protein